MVYLLAWTRQDTSWITVERAADPNSTLAPEPRSKPLFRASWDRLLSPELMPPTGVELERLPSTWTTAATAAIDVPGYQQPAVELPKRQTMTPEAKARLAAQFARGSKQPREAVSPGDQPSRCRSFRHWS